MSENIVSFKIPSMVLEQRIYNKYWEKIRKKNKKKSSLLRNFQENHFFLKKYNILRYIPVEILLNLKTSFLSKISVQIWPLFSR